MDTLREKPKAYSYVRMSSDIQLRGDSLRRQVEASKKYAEENGLQLVEGFKLQDIGVSAYKGDNIQTGSLGKFLQLINEGEIAAGSYLLVESLDRISRQSLSDSIPLFMSINSKINVVTLGDKRLYPAGKADFTDMIMSVVILSRAFEESQTKSLRVSAAWQNKRNNLGVKKLTKVCPAWLKLSDDRTSYEVVAGRDLVIKRLFSEADAGHGSFAISRKLNLENLPTFGPSKGWYDSYVSKILTNRAVIGEFQPHRYIDGVATPAGDAISGYFPQIISEDLFLRVQAERRLRLVDGAGRKGPENRNLFTHIAKCEYCGSPMRFLNKGPGPKGGFYLKCTSAVRKVGCVVIGWKYADFEASFLFFVREIDLTTTLKSAEAKSERLIFEERVRSINEKIRELESKRDQTYSLLGTVPNDFLRRKLDECEADIISQVALKHEVEARLSKLGEIADFDADEIKNLISGLQSGTGPERAARRAAVAKRLRTIVLSLTVAPEGSTPQLWRIKSLLDTSGLTRDEQSKLETYIKDSQITSGRNNRSFTVVLADGIIRRVVVGNDDPTNLITSVEVDAKGAITGANEFFTWDKDIDWEDENSSPMDK